MATKWSELWWQPKHFLNLLLTRRDWGPACSLLLCLTPLPPPRRDGWGTDPTPPSFRNLPETVSGYLFDFFVRYIKFAQSPAPSPGSFGSFSLTKKRDPPPQTPLVFQGSDCFSKPFFKSSFHFLSPHPRSPLKLNWCSSSPPNTSFMTPPFLLPCFFENSPCYTLGKRICQARYPVFFCFDSLRF